MVAQPVTEVEAAEPPPQGVAATAHDRAASGRGSGGAPPGSIGGGGAPPRSIGSSGNIGGGGAPEAGSAAAKVQRPVERVTEQQAEYVVMCDSFLEFVNAEGGLDGRAAEVEDGINSSGYKYTAVVACPSGDMDTMFKGVTRLNKVVETRNTKYKAVVIILLGNDLVKRSGLKYDAGEWKRLQGPRLIENARLLGTLVGQVAHRAMIVYGGEADKWGGSRAVKGKRWKEVDRDEYNIRVQQVVQTFQELGVNATNGVDDLASLLTGNTDCDCDSKDAWHFSVKAMPAIIDLVKKWIVEAKPPRQLPEQKAAAVAEPPAPLKAAAVAEPLAHATRAKWAARKAPLARRVGGGIDPDLERFLGVAENAARLLPDVTPSGAVVTQIVAEVGAVCGQIRQNCGLPEQADVFQGNINRVAWCA